MIGFIAPYTFIQFGNTGSYTAIAIVRTLRFTVAHALGFSVFPCIVATVSLSVQITREVFFAQRNSFLPLFCNWQFRRLDAVQLLCSQADIPVTWRAETRLFTSRLQFYTLVLYFCSHYSVPSSGSGLLYHLGTDHTKTHPVLLTRRVRRAVAYQQTSYCSARFLLG
jgi:hypothetical protein